MNGSKSKSRGRGSLNEVRPRRPEQCGEKFGPYLGRIVSMKSGLEGRNNRPRSSTGRHSSRVSMKSGLEGRNNESRQGHPRPLPPSLNEVRPRRPEQSAGRIDRLNTEYTVSMKSGLEGRNNGDTWLDYAPVFIASQ